MASFELQLVEFLSILDVLVVTETSYVEIRTMLLQLQVDIKNGLVIEMSQLQFFVGMFAAFKTETVVQIAMVNIIQIENTTFGRYQITNGF